MKCNGIHLVSSYIRKECIIIAAFLILPGSELLAQHQHAKTPLTAPGHDIFGAVQEAVNRLQKNPETDWKQVNIEALRQHLLDMKAITEKVNVKEKENIEKGIKLTVHPQTSRAQKALKRVLDMHPAMLRKEKGWVMKTRHEDGAWIIRCRTTNSEEVPKIRALGYIGLLVTGAHHQKHHWRIATGQMSYPK